MPVFGGWGGGVGFGFLGGGGGRETRAPPKPRGKKGGTLFITAKRATNNYLSFLR